MSSDSHLVVSAVPRGGMIWTIKRSSTVIGEIEIRMGERFFVAKPNLRAIEPVRFVLPIISQFTFNHFGIVCGPPIIQPGDRFAIRL
jgi:hypothetical protein